MRTNSETRRGSHLGRAPECVCSTADNSDLNANVTGRQSCGLCDSSGRAYVVCDYNAGLYLTFLDGDTAGYSGGCEEALRFATEQEARAFGEQSEEVFRRPCLIECWPATLEDKL